MRLVQTKIPGVTIIEPDPIVDERGSFARVFCREELAKGGISIDIQQTNISHNLRTRTLRGMHYQALPHGEAKLVQCTRGRIFDVAVDLRPESVTFREWVGVELEPESSRSLYIPIGCAHGFMTLEDDTDVFYMMGNVFVPGSGRGLRWNDPALGIEWPAEPESISERDALYPDFVF